mmetsp:Transcript_2099/g.6173  ORF Transcript_2099/g.6173 Transcript_2099/m.6173 type:complete len:218 (+) Transcript_2099:698-1351(+)
MLRPHGLLHAGLDRRPLQGPRPLHREPGRPLLERRAGHPAVSRRDPVEARRRDGRPAPRPAPALCGLPGGPPAPRRRGRAAPAGRRGERTQRRCPDPAGVPAAGPAARGAAGAHRRFFFRRGVRNRAAAARFGRRERRGFGGRIGRGGRAPRVRRRPGRSGDQRVHIVAASEPQGRHGLNTTAFPIEKPPVILCTSAGACVRVRALGCAVSEMEACG